LLICDTLVTFEHEVDWFWSGRMTGARILFFANRYLSLTGNVLGLTGFVPFSDKASCQALWLVHPAMCIKSLYQNILVFSALRAFVQTRNKPLSIFVFILGLVPVGINLVH
ncbi:hypothetical protein C8Q74DRAFT_1184799, partial [Fomes fomentarius]